MSAVSVSLDAAAGRQLRDLGIAEVSAHNDGWLDSALAGLECWSRDQECFAIEEFRAWWLAQENPPPAHHNAWGALGRVATNHGLIRPVGTRLAKVPAAHARLVRTYVPCFRRDQSTKAA